MDTEIPTIHDVRNAMDVYSRKFYPTPIVRSGSLSELAGCDVYLKLECYQPIRVFKIRGAYYRLYLSEKKKVVAASSGNHGIAVSFASSILGKECKVVVPENAVKEKVDTIKEFGAEVIKFGKFSKEREEKARKIASEEDADFVHPFNDRYVVAGQGTCGLEIMNQLSEFDSVIVPVGGGGLISGIAIALKGNSSASVYSAEPDGAAKLKKSLEQGRIVSIERPYSVADGLIPNSVGSIAFKICKDSVAGSFSVSENEIQEAARLLFEKAHVVSEPSGAVPLAALIKNRKMFEKKKVVLVVSGGNVSSSFLKSIL